MLSYTLYRLAGNTVKLRVMNTFDGVDGAAKPGVWTIDWAKVVPHGMSVDEWLDTPDPIDDETFNRMFNRG